MSQLLSDAGTVVAILAALGTALGTIGGALEASSNAKVVAVGNVLAGAGVDLLSVGKGLGGIFGGGK